MSENPKTLEQALSPKTQDGEAREIGLRARGVMVVVLRIVLMTAITCIPLWWIVTEREDAHLVSLGLFIVLISVLALAGRQRRLQIKGRPHRSVRHPLLAHDRLGFMGALRLDAKTVILDGSNLYHFGLDERLGPRAISLLADQLRDDGYRVVCFFDANIFYRLEEYGVIPKGQRHELDVLLLCFGLKPDELYVVPSGVQADKYILDVLKHLPISFAVTNDQFRDYAKFYPTVMKGDQWRKGVEVSKNELRIIKHRFSKPLYLS